MDNKMFRVFGPAFRILFCLGIVSYIHVNGQGGALFKVHEDCRLHELCPLNCVRCDTTPQCYDMSDEFGCGHGMDVFHKLFPGPPIPTGTTLDKLKETLWLEKVAYIRDQLQKSLNNNITVKTGEILFKGVINTEPLSDKKKPVYSSSVKPTTLPARYTDYKSVTTTPSYTRFNSRIVQTNPSRTDFKTNNQNIPSIYSPRADASPLIKWPGTSERIPTSPEKGKSEQETEESQRVAGVAVPILPDPYPDPEPPSKVDEAIKSEFPAVAPTAPVVMPPIEVPPQVTATPEPVQYQEPTTAPKTTIDRQTAAKDNDSIKERIIVFRPEPTPETGATVSLPKVTTKQDTVVAAIDSVFNTLLEPQNDPLSSNIEQSQAPTLSLSQIPMSTGAIPNLSQNTVTNPQTGVANTGNSEPSSNINNIYQESLGTFQDQPLPSIPMLPGLIPQIQASPGVTNKGSEPLIDYKVGDLFMALPPVIKTPDSSTVTDKQGVLNVDSEPKRIGTNSKPVEGIPVSITDNKSFTVSPRSRANDNINTWSSNQQETHNKQIAVHLQNMEFKQTPVDRQDKERIPSAKGQQNVEIANSFDQSGSIDLLSLLFPGLKEKASQSISQVPKSTSQETNVVINNTPNTMPEIVPAKQTTPDSTSVTISVSKGDNGNGCDRVQDYTGFCSTRTHGHFRNNYDCASYIVCDWGMMHVCRCPQYTMFDPDLGVCNWETEVECL